MFKKYIIFSFLIFLLISCGTDYYYSSFVIRKDLQWFASPSEQENINDYSSISSQSGNFNEYTSPSIVSTPANYIVAIYESRSQFNGNLLGVDGNNVANVRASISLNAASFKEFNNYVGKQAYTAEDSKGSPITFLTPNGKIIVIAIGGVGLSDGGKDDRSIIYKTKSENNGYKWDDWTELDTNTFEKLTKDKYDRYYTNPGNGIVLGNGTLACMIDFKKKGNGNTNPEGAAILYSGDSGETWRIGGKMMYNGTHRSARIIAERTDGSLLIAAVPNINGTDYNTKGPLKWGIAKTINSDIEDFQVTYEGTTNPFEKNSAGTVSGDRIKYTSNGISGNAIILIHSWDYREMPRPNGGTYQTHNSSAISISKNEGKTWSMITNIVGQDPHPKYKATFRQSLKVLKDGTIALAIEEGNGEKITTTPPAGSTLNFIPTYRRVSLESLSEGTYKYEGL
ncbi:sialidase family protein [Brachyspira pilosicoli]|uniref:sialidase family protein n=1 Tax=Brachyspira pilosicoli TaxID=52584 RepID=UPI000E15B0FB|nr:sialidase family protein [Brachyspira pilosicoli]SUW00104.1 sialidase (neuraminidase) family protein-like protein [Brachyspira pilosicoli]